jgi:hypothetical protein
LQLLNLLMRLTQANFFEGRRILLQTNHIDSRAAAILIWLDRHETYPTYRIPRCMLLII